MTSRARLANQAWEAMLTAHAQLMREFQDDPIWRELSMREYDVLYALSKCGAPVSLRELNAHVLLSQPAMSRLVDRLVDRALVARARDPEDGRGVLLSLTPDGAALQRQVGRAHALAVSRAMSRALDSGQLLEMTELCNELIRKAKVIA